MKIKQQLKNFLSGKFQAFHLNQCVFVYVISSITNIWWIEACSEFNSMENVEIFTGLFKKKSKLIFHLKDLEAGRKAQ